MRFYTESHKYYCGMDLHSRNMYVAIRDSEGKKCFHKRVSNCRKELLRVLEPYRPDVVVAVESTFNWYWVADVCAEEKIPFVLGHAFYMKAIHQGKSKNDAIDSDKICKLTAAKMLPQSYVYPRELRMTRDLLRRRLYYVRLRAALKGHVEIVNSQYNLEPLNGAANYRGKRADVVRHFTENDLKCGVVADLVLVENLDEVIRGVEKHIVRNAKLQNREVFELLQTIDGVGKILSLTFLYEMHNVERFSQSQHFCSYARLVKGQKTSNGKMTSGGGTKIGNPYLKWAFSEASVQIVKNNEQVAKYFERLKKQHQKAGAYARLSHKLGRTVYHMLKNGEAFNVEKFLGI